MSFTNIKYKIKDLIDKIIAKIKQFMFTIKKKMMETNYQQLSEKVEAVLKTMSMTGIIKMIVVDNIEGIGRNRFYPFVAIDPSVVQSLISDMKDMMVDDSHTPVGDVSQFNAIIQIGSSALDGLLPLAQDIVSHPENFVADVNIESARPSVALKIMLKAQECNLKAMELWKRGMNSIMSRVSSDDNRRLSILNTYNSRMIQVINLMTQLANIQGKQYIEGLRTIVKYGKTQQVDDTSSLESAYDILYSDIELI